MFKWFAPLLLFVGKPDVLIRLVTIVIAGAILAFGVWLISNVALTVDTLKNPYIAAVYGIVLFCFFVGVGTTVWLRLRRAAARKPSPPPQLPELPLPKELVSQRAEKISKTWERRNRRLASPAQGPANAPPASLAPTELARSSLPARASLMVTGPAYTGKTGLIAVLVQATSANPAETSDIVRLVDAGPFDGDARHIAALTADAAALDGVLFVIDQDLRAPEVAAIGSFIATGKPLYVVLNKADQFNAADRDAILLSVRAKMPKEFMPGHVVSVAGTPSPVEREIEDTRGAVRIELRRPSSDVRALTNLLYRIFPLAAGRTLRFEAERQSRT